MNAKEDVARRLAAAHREVDPSIVRIVRITTAGEENPAEPVKLLEVNPDTSPSGIVPIAFGSAGGNPFPSVVIEVTPAEFEKLRRQELQLPSGWTLGEMLYEAAGAASDAGP
jgi:hypothetical protein